MCVPDTDDTTHARAHTHAQLLRKANFSTPKTWAMFRPSDMQLSSTAGDKAAPAQVTERHNLGWIIKYHLKFDDDVVSFGRQLFIVSWFHLRQVQSDKHPRSQRKALPEKTLPICTCRLAGDHVQRDSRPR